jgi:hypothetical protein
MTRSRSFRPAVGDRLEDRTVPSGIGFGLGNAIGDVPSQDARELIGEFHTFDRSFVNDFRAYVAAVNSGSTTAADTFHTAIGTDVANLTASVDATIANLASTNADLTASVNSKLTNLQTELTSLALPTDTTHRTAERFLNQAFRDVNQTFYQVYNQVRTATPPTSAISGATFNQVLGNVLRSFRTFYQSYDSAIRNPATRPSTNRTAFDNAVGTALNTLNANLTSALSPLPSTVSASLQTQFSSDLLTSSGGSTSLQAKLAALSTPSSGFFSTLWFRIRSYRDIGVTQGQVVRQLVTAVRDYNTSLTSTT